MLQSKPIEKILLIQTAFIGDAILATALVESLADRYQRKVDVLVRKGNSIFFDENPKVENVYVWDKKGAIKKYRNLFTLLLQIRQERYHLIVNLQRFAATGLITALSRARNKVGFKQNPFSFLFAYTVKHAVQNGLHEIDRNLDLVKSFDAKIELRKPKLYLGDNLLLSIKHYKQNEYVCIFPGSVWFSKRLSTYKWVELIEQFPKGLKVYFLGAADDEAIANKIAQNAKLQNFENLCGRLNLLQSAALGKDAVMNYCNDSAPVHFLSAVNARVQCFFLSTSPLFGFYPISDDSKVQQVEILDCKPCGMVGKKTCPLGHFDCCNRLEPKAML